jgi:hypothetical protein
LVLYNSSTLLSPSRLPGKTGQLTWLAGLALIAVGILCLSLSGTVAQPAQSAGTSVAESQSWWQGTLDAFGVGFVVGGIVDVLALSAMGRYSTGWQRHWNDEALELVKRARTARPGSLDSMLLGKSARRLLEAAGEMYDPRVSRADRLLPELRSELEKVINQSPYGWDRENLWLAGSPRSVSARAGRGRRSIPAQRNPGFAPGLGLHRLQRPGPHRPRVQGQERQPSTDA